MSRFRELFDKYCFAVLFVLLLVASCAVLAATALPPTTETIVFTGLCDGWKAWREKDGNLWVGCPGRTPPAGAVELRAYYPPVTRNIGK
jgi:hypothetical protein